MEKEPIKIDIFEELLKGIEIVHGKQYAYAFRNLVNKWKESHKFDCVEWD